MNETLDHLSIGDLQLFQAKGGYRFSLDPVLLARFVRHKSVSRVFDLGTGNGILPLLLAKMTDARELVGIELQESLAERAQRNVEWNSLQERVQIQLADIRVLKNIYPAACADLVVSNPPYRSADSGRAAPNEERAAARHELFGGLNEFVSAAGWLLKNGGIFALVHLAERLPALIASMVAVNIEPKRLRMVHPRQGVAARLILLEGRKGGRPGLDIEPPLIIYKNSGPAREYTDEVMKMYDLDVLPAD